MSNSLSMVTHVCHRRCHCYFVVVFVVAIVIVIVNIIVIAYSKGNLFRIVTWDTHLVYLVVMYFIKFNYRYYEPIPYSMMRIPVGGRCCHHGLVLWPPPVPQVLDPSVWSVLSPQPGIVTPFRPPGYGSQWVVGVIITVRYYFDPLPYHRKCIPVGALLHHRGISSSSRILLS